MLKKLFGNPENDVNEQSIPELYLKLITVINQIKEMEAISLPFQTLQELWLKCEQICMLLDQKINQLKMIRVEKTIVAKELRKKIQNILNMLDEQHFVGQLNRIKMLGTSMLAVVEIDLETDIIFPPLSPNELIHFVKEINTHQKEKQALGLPYINNADILVNLLNQYINSEFFKRIQTTHIVSAHFLQSLTFNEKIAIYTYLSKNASLPLLRRSLACQFLHDFQCRDKTKIKHLPPEVMLKILSYLSVNDLLSITLTSKHLAMLAADHYLWQIKYLQYFTVPADELVGLLQINWKEKFHKHFSELYSHLPDKKQSMRMRKFFAYLMRQNIDGLKWLNVQLSDLKIQDSNGVIMAMHIGKINHQIVLDFIYQIVVKQHSSFLKNITHAANKNLFGFTMLHWAAFCNQAAGIKALVHQGHDINALNEFGVTPLAVAVQFFRQDAFYAILAVKKVDVNAHLPGCGVTALYATAFYGHFGLMRVLLAVKDININLVNPDGATPLFVAVHKNNTEMVKVLLTDIDKVDINALHVSGATALYLAAQNGYTEIVQLLLNNEKVDVNAPLLSGATPLYVAAKMGQVKIVKLLLNANSINANVTIDNGNTALFIAAKKGHLEVVQAFLQAAEQGVMVSDKSKIAARDIAKLSNHYKIVDVIEDDLKQNLNKFILQRRKINTVEASSRCGFFSAQHRKEIKAAKALKRVMFKGADESILSEHWHILEKTSFNAMHYKNK